MTSPSESCTRIRQILDALQGGQEQHANAVAAGAVWGGLSLLSVVVGIVVTLAIWARRSHLLGPIAFPWITCLSSTAFAALLGWYPAVLLYLRLRGRLSRTAAELLVQCKMGALRTACRARCQQLSARVLRQVSTRHESTLFALIVGIPPLLAVVFFAHCVFHACKKRRGTRRQAVADAGAGMLSVHVAGRSADAAVIMLALEVVTCRDADSMREEECAICLDDLWAQAVVAARCGHRFHRTCMYRWLHGSPFPSCPLCKSPVFGRDRGRAATMLTV